MNLKKTACALFVGTLALSGGGCAMDTISNGKRTQGIYAGPFGGIGVQETHEPSLREQVIDAALANPNQVVSNNTRNRVCDAKSSGAERVRRGAEIDRTLGYAPSVNCPK